VEVDLADAEEEAAVSLVFFLVFVCVCVCVCVCIVRGQGVDTGGFFGDVAEEGGFVCVCVWV
jgi:preprotein translocase subunit SecG